MTKHARVEKQPEEAWRSVALAAKRLVSEAVIRSLKTNQAQWNAMTLSDGTERVHKLDATNAEVAAAIAGGIQLPPNCELRSFDRFVVEHRKASRRSNGDRLQCGKGWFGLLKKQMDAGDVFVRVSNHSMYSGTEAGM